MCFGDAHIHFGQNEMNTKEHSIIISIWEQKNFGGNIISGCTVCCSVHGTMYVWEKEGMTDVSVAITVYANPVQRLSFIEWRMAGGVWVDLAQCISRAHFSKPGPTTQQNNLCSFFAAGFNVYNLCILLHMHVSFECPTAVAAAATAAPSLGEKSRSSIKHFLLSLLLLNLNVCVRRCCFLALFSMANRLVEC